MAVPPPETSSESPAVGQPRVVSVNVGTPRTVPWHGHLVTSAIWKQPVNGPVALAGVNFAGDDQADRRVHGGVDKAVYAYSREDYDWWAATTGPLEDGTFGENLTTAGIDLGAAQIGDRWLVGSAELEVAQPREPCYKLGIRMEDEQFPLKFAAAARPGVYLRIVTPGAVEAGDAIALRPAQQPAISLSSLVAEEFSEELLFQLIDDPRVPDHWKRVARRTLEQ